MKTREARFSKDVDKANKATFEAMDALKIALQNAYPKGEFVRVIHSRGEYAGFVVGHSEYGARVFIENHMTGKISRPYFRHVELEFNSESIRRCRVCGCTDDDCSGCIERTGQPCHWVEKDLCSACCIDSTLTVSVSNLPA